MVLIKEQNYKLQENINDLTDIQISFLMQVQAVYVDIMDRKRKQ